MTTVFTLDDRIRGLPAGREQVISLYQSINQPHLGIPGRKAGPSQGFIVSLKGQSGITTFVYLFLGDSLECALYVPERRNLRPEAVQSEENDALGFVESMGFIMDNMNYRALPPEEQEALIKTLPLFRKDPKQGAPEKKPGGEATKEGSPFTQLSRLLSSF